MSVRRYRLLFILIPAIIFALRRYCGAAEESGNWLWAVGYNYLGQLGDRTDTLIRPVPVLVETGVVSVAVGEAFSVYLKGDGSLWTRGYNRNGGLGDGLTESSVIPIQIATGIVSVSAGYQHAAFVKADKTLWTWGENFQGQLGDGTNTHRRTPVRIASDVNSVFCGAYHTYFLKADGGLWATGNGGLLSDGGTATRFTPIQVAQGVRAVGGGRGHTLYIKNDGTLWRSGYNMFGVLETIASQMASGVSAVGSGVAGYFFIKTDETLWAMGSNANGQLGDGTTIDRTAPVMIARGVAKVVNGGFHTLILKTDGTLWTTGFNAFGQLADGTTTDRSSPLLVANNVVSIAADSSKSFFVQRTNVGTRPSIGAQPVGGVFEWLSSRTLSITAAGSTPLSYQWYKNGVAMSDARSSSITLPLLGASDAASYTVVVVNAAGSITSSSAIVAVSGAAAIVTQPSAAVVSLGASTAFTVLASGRVPLSYQWYKDGEALVGATNQVLTIMGVMEINAGIYTVAVTNFAGSITSVGSVLTVNIPAPPRITTQPVASRVTSGSSVRLNVTATGLPQSYQWYKNGEVIASATSDSFSIENSMLTDSGYYSVVVTNLGGSVLSESAILVVEPSTRLSNLSVRTAMAAGDTLIVGFSVSGGSRPILVRGVGPTLTSLGLTGAMADPRLELYNSKDVIAENNDWGDAGLLSAAFGSVAAFPLVAGSRDAALIQLVDGTRSVHLKGTGAGVTLVELYDIGTGNTPRLVNVSARSQVGAGDNILIFGFYVDGAGTKNVLIRAIGPRLADLGVNGVLADPKFDVHRSGTTGSIATNDNWDASLANTFSAVGAFSLTVGSRDAAFVASLTPGAYTVQVSGVNNGTGEALVEIYEVP